MPEPFTGWDTSLRALVADADGALVPRWVHALPCRSGTAGTGCRA